MLVWSSGQWITTHTHTHTHTHTYNRKQARADVQGDIHSDTHTTSLQEPLLQIVEQDVLHILDMYEFLHVLRTICANSKLVRCYMNNKRIKAFQSISCKDTDVSAMTHSCGIHLRALQLNGCVHLSNSAVHSIGSSCPELEVLDVSGCWQITCLLPLAGCGLLRCVLCVYVCVCVCVFADRRRRR